MSARSPYAQPPLLTAHYDALVRDVGAWGNLGLRIHDPVEAPWALRMGSLRLVPRARLLVLAALLGPVALVAPARADDSAPTAAEKGRAKKLLERGVKLYSQGKLDEAMTAFKQSREVAPDPKALLMIARVQRDQGELLKAHDTYKNALDQAEHAQARGEARRATIDELRRDLRDLDGILGWITIELSHAPSGTRVSIDGNDVTAKLEGPIRVAPGPIVVLATAPGGVEKSRKLSVKAGETANVELAFTWSGPSDQTLSDEADEADSGGTVAASEEPESPRASGGGKTLAWVAGGVGVAGVAVFGVLGAMSNAKFSELEAACPDNHCPPDLEGDRSDGQTFQTIANVGLVVGVVGLGTAVTLFALGGPSESAYSAKSSTPRLTVGLGSIQLRGRFQ